MANTATLALVLATLTTFPATAYAGNYENVVFGERSSGMGGAGIALADEPSSVFYNPAGLAQLETDIIGLSVQAGGRLAYSADGLLRLGSQRGSVEQTTIGAVPPSTAYVIPLGAKGAIRYAVGLSIVTPRDERLGTEQALVDGPTTVLLATNLVERETLAGLTFAVRVRGLHVGATLFGEYASVTFERLRSVADRAPDTDVLVTSDRRSKGQQVGLTGVLGLLYRFNERWSVGLRVRAPNLRIAGTAEHTFVQTEVGASSEQGTNITVAGVRGDMRYRHPWGIGVGTAFRSARVHVALDARMYLPMDAYARFGPTTDTMSWDAQVDLPARGVVVNGALGVEAFFTRRFSLLSGLFTDAASMSPETPVGLAGTATMHFVGAALGVRTRSKAGTFTVSLTARHGRGTLNSVVYDEGFARGGPARVEQSAAIVTLSWMRSLVEDWRAPR
ncbi:MAG: outer membrane protein transport protein [Nannocystaceae bacterium]|nr:outer membrane protein transport protein [Nannocystaceae bacterium]